MACGRLVGQQNLQASESLGSLTQDLQTWLPQHRLVDMSCPFQRFARRFSPTFSSDMMGFVYARFRIIRYPPLVVLNHGKPIARNCFPEVCYSCHLAATS